MHSVFLYHAIPAAGLDMGIVNAGQLGRSTKKIPPEILLKHMRKTSYSTADRGCATERPPRNRRFGAGQRPGRRPAI